MELLRSIAGLYGFSRKDLNQTPWEQGRLACLAEVEIEDNPFFSESVPFSEWEKGYKHAMEACNG